MMYVDVTREGQVNLMGMSAMDAHDLMCMIKGSDLTHRRTFNSVLQQLVDISVDANSKKTT